MIQKQEYRIQNDGRFGCEIVPTEISSERTALAGTGWQTAVSDSEFWLPELLRQIKPGNSAGGGAPDPLGQKVPS